MAYGVDWGRVPDSGSHHEHIRGETQHVELYTSRTPPSSMSVASQFGTKAQVRLKANGGVGALDDVVEHGMVPSVGAETSRTRARGFVRMPREAFSINPSKRR